MNRCWSPSPNGHRRLPALYERHAGCSRFGSPAAATTVTRRGRMQDTFVVVWQEPRGFRGDGDIAAWLWGIASAG